MKTLVTKRHVVRLGNKDTDFGIRIGWRVIDREGKSSDWWWGSTKNEETLQDLIANMRAENDDFDVLDLEKTASEQP